MQSRSRLALCMFFLALAVLACSRDMATPVYNVTATPKEADIGAGVIQNPTATGLPSPLPAAPVGTPTPDPTRPAADPIYIVQANDTLLDIAKLYDTNIPELVALNGLADEFNIYAGQVLKMPAAPTETTPVHKIIPDSELVYGPALRDFDIDAFLVPFPGYLTAYTEEVDGGVLTGAQIVRRVAQNFSISPRLLLALLEHTGGWLLRPTLSQFEIDYPMGYAEPNFTGLYKQMRWAANQLSAGYYGWRNRGLSALTFPTDPPMALAPGLNAGTVAIQYFFAQMLDRDSWYPQVIPSGFYTTYVALFGSPFSHAVEPLVPPDLAQPALVLPWAEDETWYYTGGPHGAWATGSAWAAIDFAPPGEMMGCYIAESPTRAVAPGVVARSEEGAVLLDLDGDGYEGTGWVIFYLHLANRVEAGSAVNAGDIVGYASCEGGFSTATHVHIARKYNGEWIPIQCEHCTQTLNAPTFVLGGWTVGGFTGQEYDGYMTRAEEYREAFDGGRVEISAVVW